MKANELMIGDWVDFLIDETDEMLEYQPMQVNTIASWEVGGEVESIEGVVNDPEQLRPIPLTEEILAKNFENNGGQRYTFSGDFQDVAITEYTDGLWQVLVDEVEMGGLPTWEMYVSHVHELQHALLLAGVDKEIEL